MPHCVSYDGTRLKYATYGPADASVTVFFVHGFASGSSLWDAQVPAMSARGYRSVTYDMRGHAASESPPPNSGFNPNCYSKWSQIMDMKAVLAAAGVVGFHAKTKPAAQEQNTLIMVGHSMGGMDTMLFALQFPRIPDALVLYGTGPGFRSDKGRLGWNKTAEKIAAKYDRIGLDALVGSDKDKGHTSAEGLAASCRGNFAQRDDDPLAMQLGGPLFLAREGLGKIVQPCLILIGQHDKGFGRASNMMAGELPVAHLTRIPNAGHLMCEKNVDAFNTALLSGLSKIIDEVRSKRSNISSNVTSRL